MLGLRLGFSVRFWVRFRQFSSQWILTLAYCGWRGVDAWSIRVEWRRTSAVNGPIERYVLYLSTDAESQGSVVYNSSQLLTYHTIDNLTAATQYFIRLAVSWRCFDLLIMIYYSAHVWPDDVTVRAIG